MDTNILSSVDMHELGRNLQQARKKRGLTQAEAAAIIDVARTTVTAIEKGERRIKSDELIKLARTYGRQVSDFIRPRPIVEPFAVQFRSSYQRTSEDDEQIAEYINMFEDLCRNYLELEKITDSSIVQRYPSEYQIGGLPLERVAESIAQEERNRLGLGDGPISVLRDILEQDVGLRIFYIAMKPSNKFSAMYTYDSQLGGCIAVNRLHIEERRRMSLAHDYAHFLTSRHRSSVHFEGVYQRQPESERFADYFARYFLMPTNGLTRRYNDIRQAQEKFTLADLCTLAHYYGVSVEGLTRHLEDLKLLRTGTWERVQDSGFRVQKAQEELGLAPIPANDHMLPKRYQYLAIYAYNQGWISEGQFAKFLQVERLEARRVAEVLQRETDNVLEGEPLDPAQPQIG